MFKFSEIISSDKIKAYIDNLPSLKYVYYKLDNVFNSSIFEGKNIEKYNNNSEKLILGHSSYDITKSISDHLIKQQPELKIYSPNASSPDVEPLPFGVLEDNINLIQVVSAENNIRNKLCYLNVNPLTYEHRKVLIDYFSKFDWITYEEPLYTIEGKKNYFSQLSMHNFIMCPRGRGIDTNRLWESLYMGSIPIVIYEDCHRSFTDLPILFIHNWSVITKEFLELKLKEFNSRTWNMDKLKLSYWINHIMMTEFNIYLKLNKSQTLSQTKPQTYFITFGSTNKYNLILPKIHKEATQINMFDKIIIYTENDFDKDFLSLHKNFMEKNHGYGYWIWKPYFIKKTLQMMNPNDILIYADAGCKIVNTPEAKQRLTSYIDLARTHFCGNVSFEMVFLEGEYTKMDVLTKLDYKEKAMTKQLVGGIFIMKKNDLMVKLIDEFNMICSDYSMIDDSPSIENNITNFKVHRHDQSIFSILRKKYGTISVPDDTWFKNFSSPEALQVPILATRIRQK